MARWTWWVMACVAAGCGDDDDDDDAAGDDAAVAEDDASVDAGLDASVTTCGDGVVDVGERCDGEPVECGALGSSWSDGAAPCRADCSGWDIGGCTLAAPGSIEMVKPAERDPRWETARCNDGTPFGFSVRVTGSADWIVYLQGGVYCDDESFDCAERAQRSVGLTTTPPPPDGGIAPVPGTGVLSSDAGVNPDLAGANQVLAFYCSSDFWAGATIERRPTGADPEGWYFSGRANVDAMLDLLAERYGLDDASDDLRVLFGGGSAGAFGAHFNAARAAERLPRAAAGGRLRVLVDAGWMTDWDDPGHRLGRSSVPDREVWSLARDFWGATFDPVCEASAARPADCFFGPSWHPAVAAALPVLLQQSPTDASFMGVHGIDPGDPAVDAWRDEVAASLEPVEWLFSADRFVHVLGTCDDALSWGPPGESFGEVIGRFFDDGSPERIVFGDLAPPSC